MGMARGLVLAPTDTSQSFFVTPESSRTAASSFWWLWSAKSSQEEGRGEHFWPCILLILYEQQNIKRDED